MIITVEVLDRPQLIFTPRPTNFSENSPVKRAISPPLHDKKKKAKTTPEIMPCPQTVVLNSNNAIPHQVTTASIFLSSPGDDSNNVTKLKCDPFVISAEITSPHIHVHPSMRRRELNQKLKEKGTAKETEELLNKLNTSSSPFTKDFKKTDLGGSDKIGNKNVHSNLAKERRKSPFSSSVTAKENTQPDDGCDNDGKNTKIRKTSNIFHRLGEFRRNSNLSSSDETTSPNSRPTILGSNSSSRDPQIRSKTAEDTSVPFQKSHPLRHTLGTTRVINRSRPGPSQLAKGNNTPIKSSPLTTRTNVLKDTSKVCGTKGSPTTSTKSAASPNLNDLAVLTRLRNEYNKNKDKDNITEEPFNSRNNSISGNLLKIRNDSLTVGGSGQCKRPSISILQNNIAFVNELRSRNNSLTNGELRTRNNSLTSVVNYRPGSRNNSIAETSATSFTNKQSLGARPSPKIPNCTAAKTANVAGKATSGSLSGRGRQGKSPSAKGGAKRPNKRMDKTVTTQTRTFQKDGLWFEETVETTVVENKDGSRTTTKTTTKQLPGPPKSAGSSQRARSTSSSSRSPSPQRQVKKKDSSSGGGLFSRFRTKKDSSSSSDDDQDDIDKSFSKDVLEAINEKRSKHGVKGLKMSSKLTHEARQWAKHLASKDKMQHKQDQQFGENIYRLSANLPVDKGVASGKSIVDQWYSESDKHKFGQEPSGAKLETGHFTQIVWKDSKELGVGIALSDTKRNIYVVAFFSPKGNWMGEFATKVPPIGGFLPSSAKKGGLVDKIGKVSVTSGSSSSDEEEDFNEAVLKAHNQYRSKHGVPPLKISKKLNKFAEEWATKIAKRDRMEHRPNNEYGENLYAKWNSKPNHTIPGSEAVESWYSEITGYPFGREPTSLAAGHFTQVIWEDSKELGIGLARNKSSGKLYVVCNYEPAGNMVGSFAKKVPPPKK